MHTYVPVIVRVQLFSVCTIKRRKGATAVRACGVLIVKILNKRLLSMLVYNLFHKQTVQYFHTPVSWPSSCNRNSYFFKKYCYLIERKDRFDNNAIKSDERITNKHSFIICVRIKKISSFITFFNKQLRG